MYVDRYIYWPGHMPTAQDRAAGAMLGYPGRVFVVLLLAVLVWAQASPKEARCGLDRKDMPEQDREQR